MDIRPERRSLFEKRTSEIGVSVPRFSAVYVDQEKLPEKLKKYDRSHFKVGCTLSHQAIVKTAKENKWENVLIFEDDCVFLPDFVSKMEGYVNELRNTSWDLFYMGGEPNVLCLPLTDNLRLCPPNGGIYGTHAYAVNQSLYNKVLELNAFQESPIDNLYIHMHNRRYVITKELLVTQDDLESDLWGGVIKRTEQYKETYNRYVK